MKTIPFHLILALLAGTAAAREPRGGNGHRPPPQGPPQAGEQAPAPPPAAPILALFDTDRDGVLSAREIRKASDALTALDRNGDRQITRDELLPPPPAGAGDAPKPGKPPGHRPPPPVIAAMDTNKDGTLSAEELRAAPESLLELDINEDGELSPEELHPHGPPPPPPGDEPMPEE